MLYCFTNKIWSTVGFQQTVVNLLEKVTGA
jgi:hypothetical protein